MRSSFYHLFTQGPFSLPLERLSAARHSGAHLNPRAKDADAGGSQGQQDFVSRIFFPIDFLVLGRFLKHP